MSKKEAVIPHANEELHAIIRNAKEETKMSNELQLEARNQVQTVKDKLFSHPTMKKLYRQFYNIVLAEEHKKHTEQALAVNQNMKSSKFKVHIFTLEEYEETFLSHPMAEGALLYGFCTETRSFIENDRVKSYLEQRKKEKEATRKSFEQFLTSSNMTEEKKNQLQENWKQMQHQMIFMDGLKLAEIVAGEVASGNIILDDQENISSNILNSDRSYIPSNSSMLNAGYHLANKHVYEKQGGSFLDRIENNIQAVSQFLFKEKRYELLKVQESDLAQIGDSLQSLYFYLLIQLATNHYERKFTLNVKHYFKFFGKTKQPKTVKTLIKHLDVLAGTTFRYIGVRHNKGKNEVVTSTGGLLSYRKITTPKGYLKQIEIIFGDWLDLAKEIENRKSIRIEPGFLTINQRKFPFAKTYFMKMRERWRFNRKDRLKKKAETETISLKTLLETSGEWYDIHNRAKKRGLTGDKGVLNKIEKCLVHLREHGVKWEWSFLPERTEHLDKVNIIYSMPYDE